MLDMATGNQQVPASCFGRFVAATAQVVLFCCSFALPAWVNADHADYGLWNVCFTNITNLTEGDSCNSTTFGDGPAYYDAVRVFGCALIPLYAVQLFSCMDGVFLDKGKRFFKVSLLATVLVSILVVVMLASYEDDERWKDDNPSLGASFFLSVASVGWGVIICVVHWKHDNARLELKAEAEAARKEQEAGKSAGGKSQRPAEGGEGGRVSRNAVAPSPPPVPPQTGLSSSSPTNSPDQSPVPRPAAPKDHHHLPPLVSVPPPLVARQAPGSIASSPSSLSLSSSSLPCSEENLDESLTDAQDNGEERGAVSRVSLYAEDLRSAQASRMDFQQDPTEKEFPLLDRLPSYTLPPRKGSRPRTAPPSYDEAVRGDYKEMPPPPGVTLPDNPFQGGRA